jgi:putative phage-type endonuclease
MKLIVCQQGTPEWHAARLGVITASRAADACGRLKSGGFTSSAVAYAAQVAMERATLVPCDDTFVNYAMRRGSDLEPAARLAYEEHTGQLVQESGFVVTDDDLFGYSTDGIVGDDGLIEIKAPLSPLKVVTMWKDHDISEYRHQIQMGLWLTDRQWCDFVMYDPRLATVGKALFIQHVERDQKFIDKMEEDLLAFAALVREYEGALHETAAAEYA